MSAVNDHLIGLKDHLDDLQDTLDNAPVGRAVEVGTVLWVIIKEAEKLQAMTKDIIREDAQSRLNNKPGTVTIDGEDRCHVSVTIPAPKLRVRKDADLVVLSHILKDDFELYFETKTTYTPRTTTADLVAQLPDSPEKTVLLGSLKEVEGTPRVSFKHS